MGTYLGFDPGGAGRFGWAILSGSGLPLCLVDRGVADHAEGAFTSAMNSAEWRFDAVGIDAPLFWRKDGDRRADQLVREAITQRGCHNATVQSVNSLPGACSIQGMLVALMCQRRDANAMPMTEAHPKALLWLLDKASIERHHDDIALVDLGDYVVGAGVQGASDHERDAVLGAVAAFAMASRLIGWRDLYAIETNAITPLSPAPGYWMPF
jgi:predicted nuclease with RNAse H fold